MKKRLLFFLAFTLLFLCGCSETFESSDYHFTMKFPDDMKVFSPALTRADDPLLKEFDMDYDKLTSFGEEGGVFYAVGEEDGVKKEITVSVQESTYTQEIWELNKKDTDLVTQFQDELIETFNVSGITVKQKGQFQQGKAYCVYLNIISGNYQQFDTVYMATIYNGLQYSILYCASQPMTQDDIDECHDMFDTFYISETLQNPNEEAKDQTTTKAVLVVILILIVVFLVIMILRMFAHKKRQEEAEKDPYVPQFTDTLAGGKRKEKRK